MNKDSENSTLQIPESNKTIPSTLSMPENTQIPIKQNSPIISFTGGKKHPRFSFRRLIIPLISLFLAWMLLSAYSEHLLADRFPELAKSQAEKHLSSVIYSTVDQMAKEGVLTYSEMVKTIRDPAGEVIYLEVDTAMLAQASATLVQRLNAALEESGNIRLSVPVGSLGGWNLFSGLGFPVRARIFPIGSAYGKIYTVLEDCGINQTRHLIRVDVKISVHLILPDKTVPIQADVSLPLGERVLVGDVPEIYLDNIGGN